MRLRAESFTRATIVAGRRARASHSGRQPEFPIRRGRPAASILNTGGLYMPFLRGSEHSLSQQRFSKSWANLRAALALHFTYYNLGRVHGSLRITPAMAVGITDHVWDLNDLIA